MAGPNQSANMCIGSCRFLLTAFERPSVVKIGVTGTIVDQDTYVRKTDFCESFRRVSGNRRIIGMSFGETCRTSARAEESDSGLRDR